MDDADRGGSMDDFKIELFIFPDGTAVEMMVFDRSERSAAPSVPATSSSGLPATAAAASPQPAAPPSRCAVGHPPELSEVTTAAEVHICPVCRGDLVHPIDWQRTGEASWSLRLRCPDCETQRSVVLGRAEVEQLNRDLYHGTQALAREAQRVSRQNFEDEARRFVAALHRGDIEPIDF